MTDSKGIGSVVGGALTGASISSTIGGIGLVGGFGGVGIGIGTMTGIGTLTGAAAYGTFKAIQESDTTALATLGLGTIGGIGVSATVGGIGLSFSGTAIGLGMGSMAVAGGVVGLGLYGLAKMLNPCNTNKLYQNLDCLDQITREYEEEKFWTDLEIEEELQALKASMQI